MLAPTNHQQPSVFGLNAAVSAPRVLPLPCGSPSIASQQTPPPDPRWDRINTRLIDAIDDPNAVATQDAIEQARLYLRRLAEAMPANPPVNVGPTQEEGMEVVFRGPEGSLVLEFEADGAGLFELYHHGSMVSDGPVVKLPDGRHLLKLIFQPAR